MQPTSEVWQVLIIQLKVEKDPKHLAPVLRQTLHHGERTCKPTTSVTWLDEVARAQPVNYSQ
jgi:hypothetical protein